MQDPWQLIVQVDERRIGGVSSMEKPTVFISYSQDSEEHKKWVLKLGTDLHSHGVKVILDQWDFASWNGSSFFYGERPIRVIAGSMHLF